jgi:hypothetical protein
MPLWTPVSQIGPAFCFQNESSRFRIVMVAAGLQKSVKIKAVLILAKIGTKAL